MNIWIIICSEGLNTIFNNNHDYVPAADNSVLLK